MASLTDAPPKRPWIKRYLPRTLLGRSLLIILLPLVLLQVISTWIFYDRHYDTITRRLAQGIAGEIAAVIALMEREETALDQTQLFILADRTMWLDVTFSPGATLPPPIRRWFPAILDEKLTAALRERPGRPAWIDTVSHSKQVEIRIQLADGVLNVIASRDRLFSSTTYIFIMWMVGSSIVLFAVAMLFMRNQVRPIRRLAEAADSFGKGRDVANFKPEGAAEVRRAAAAFLRMRERIKRQIQQRTAILAGVSHDLRTPLTRMKLQLAMAKTSAEIDNLKADVAEMERMVEGYLAFARGEGGEATQDCDLGELLRDLVARSAADNRRLTLEVEPNLVLPLRREAMRRCFTNLIGNALRYGRQVAVKARREQNSITVTIDDDGPGIAESDREDVFKPFFRLEGSRNPATGGVGLGLTIARDVVRNHGGDLVLESSPLGGLRARVQLPV